MSTFGRRYPWDGPQQSTHVEVEDSWRVAQRITDNRLRAIAFWANGSERIDSWTTMHIESLRENLLKSLEALSDKRGQTRDLLEFVKALDCSKPSQFETIYHFMGIEPPGELVQGRPRAPSRRRKPREVTPEVAEMLWQR